MVTTNDDSLPYGYYDSIKEKNVDWLWYPYIPYGKITLLQGDPGEGKSTLIIHVAAALTTGSMLPGDVKADKPITVIYQCAEDNAEDTVKPRLIEAGADCSKVAFIRDNEQTLSLDDERIERCISETGAGMFVLDPLQAYIRQDGDFQSATRMRNLMRRLASVAERCHCAIVLIGHLNKSSSGKTLYRGLGSIDIAAIARSVLMISRDSSFPEMRYMHSIKSSLAPERYGIAFVLDSETGFHWIGRCLYSSDESVVMAKPSLSKRARAKELLQVMLSTEDLKSTEVFSRLAWLGISERTIRSAQKELGVEAYRKNNSWFLKLSCESNPQPEEDED
jgi:hypothetical protein